MTSSADASRIMSSNSLNKMITAFVTKIERNHCKVSLLLSFLLQEEVRHGLAAAAMMAIRSTINNRLAPRVAAITQRVRRHLLSRAARSRVRTKPPPRKAKHAELKTYEHGVGRGTGTASNSPVWPTWTDTPLFRVAARSLEDSTDSRM